MMKLQKLTENRNNLTIVLGFIISFYLIMEIMIFLEDILLPLISALIIYIIMKISADAMVKAVKRYTLKSSMPSYFAWIIITMTFLLILEFIFLIIIPEFYTVITDFSLEDSSLTKLAKKHIPHEYLKFIFNPDNFSAIINFINRHFISPFSDYFFKFFLTIFFLIMIAAEYTKFKNLFPVIEEIQDRLSTYVIVKTILSVLTGILTYLVLLYFSVPYAILFASITFLFNFIPNIGSIVAVLIPVFFSFTFLPWISSFILLFLLMTIQMIIGNIIEPRYLGNTLNLSSVFIFFFLLFFGKIWGVPGMLLSVPLTVLIREECRNHDSLNFFVKLLSND